MFFLCDFHLPGCCVDTNTAILYFLQVPSKWVQFFSEMKATERYTLKNTKNPGNIQFKIKSKFSALTKLLIMNELNRIVSERVILENFEEMFKVDSLPATSIHREYFYNWEVMTNIFIVL